MSERWMLALVVVIVLCTLGLTKLRPVVHTRTTLKGAELALRHLQEWAKWMAGVQVAALGGLALLVFDQSGARRQMGKWETFFALACFVLLGLGLFCAAWVLSSLASHAIRIYGFPEAAKQSPSVGDCFDIYEQPLYDFQLRHGKPHIKLGDVVTLQHWLWALGLAALGGHVVASFL